MKNKHVSFKFCFALNSIAYIIVMILFRSICESDDDIGINLFVNGAFENRDAHIIFQNYLLGIFYKWIYTVSARLGFAEIPWYFIIQYFLIIVSFSVILYVFFNKFKKYEMRLLIFGVMLLVYFFEAVTLIQFTKTAALLAISGMLLLYYCVLQEQLSKRLVFFGVFLIAFSELYRYEESAVCILLSVGIGIKLLLDSQGMVEKAAKCQYIRRIIGVFFSAAVVWIVLYFVDTYSYSAGQWKEYYEYNNLRSSVLDYEICGYEEYVEQYNAIGINREAYDLMNQWVFYDTDVFSKDTFSKISNMGPAKEVNLERVLDFFDVFPREFMSMFSFWGFLLLSLIFFLMRERNWKTIICMVLSWLIFIMLFFYLFYSGRYLLNRVDWGMFLTMGCVALWLCDDKEIYISSNIVTVILIVFLLVNGTKYYAFSAVAGREMQKDHNRRKAVISEAINDKEHIYFTLGGDEMSSGVFLPFDANPIGFRDNIIPMGGWQIEHPSIKESLRKYHIVNPLHDMIDNEKVYIVGEDKIEDLIAYLKTYYGNVDYRVVKKIDNVKIFSVYSKE